jgi:DNA-binding response OmpR family regulator
MAEIASPLPVLLIALRDAPPPDTLAAALAREHVAVATEARDQPVMLAWAAADVSDAELASVAAARKAAAVRPPPMLLGCAPRGPATIAERALAVGFDDFMAGRQSVRELAARLRVLARRRRVEPPAPASVSHGPLSLDPASHKVTIADRRVSLTPREVALVSALLEARGGTVTRQELLDRVWGSDELDVGLRAVDDLIVRLRRKLGDPGAIRTVRGVGFRIAAYE